MPLSNKKKLSPLHTCTLELKVIFINTPDKKVLVILRIRYMYITYIPSYISRIQKNIRVVGRDPNNCKIILYLDFVFEFYAARAQGRPDIFFQGPRKDLVT